MAVPDGAETSLHSLYTLMVEIVGEETIHQVVMVQSACTLWKDTPTHREISIPNLRNSMEYRFL